MIQVAKAKSPRAASSASSSSSSAYDKNERSELEMFKKAVGAGAAAGAALLNTTTQGAGAQDRVPEYVTRPQRVIKRTVRSRLDVIFVFGRGRNASQPAVSMFDLG